MSNQSLQTKKLDAKQELSDLLDDEIKSKRQELDSLLGVIKNKQPILDDLLLQIKTAEKTLADNFSQKELELQKAHLERVGELEAKDKVITKILEDLLEKQKSLEDGITENTNKLSNMKFKVDEERQTLNSTRAETEKLKTETLSLRSTSTTLTNQIEVLRANKKVLEDELGIQVQKNATDAYDMRSQLNTERSELETQIEESKIELRKVQQALQFNKNRQTEIDEGYNERNKDLVQRENSLVIKTKALEKQQAEFELAIRRHGYIRPVV